MHDTLAHTVYERPTLRVFRFVLTMTLVLIVLALEVGWVALWAMGSSFCSVELSEPSAGLQTQPGLSGATRRCCPSGPPKLPARHLSFFRPLKPSDFSSVPYLIFGFGSAFAAADLAQAQRSANDRAAWTPAALPWRASSNGSYIDHNSDTIFSECNSKSGCKVLSLLSQLSRSAKPCSGIDSS
jgi:hypothetical protein